MNVNSGTEVSQKRVALMPLEAVTSFLTFGGELLNNPGPVGSAVPSSRFLARRIAGFLPRTLRKGTSWSWEPGRERSRPLCSAAGFPADRLISVERSATMVKLLQRRFPSVNVTLGDAAELRALLKAYLAKESREVSYVVSSLPLRSLPEAVVRNIMTEIRTCPPQGRQTRAVHVRSSPNAAPVLVGLQTLLHHCGLGQFPAGPIGRVSEERPFGLVSSFVVPPEKTVAVQTKSR